jgi:predicted thioesterase
MEIKMEIGTVHEINVTVDENMTAASMKSGNLQVLATPYMIALMEQASAELCQKFLPVGISSVGTMVNIQHLAATSLGAPVRAIATLTDFDGRKASFEVTAYDNAGIIGKGTHERFTIKIDSFLKKTEERKSVVAQ